MPDLKWTSILRCLWLKSFGSFKPDTQPKRSAKQREEQTVMKSLCPGTNKVCGEMDLIPPSSSWNHSFLHGELAGLGEFVWSTDQLCQHHPGARQKCRFSGLYPDFLHCRNISQVLHVHAELSKPLEQPTVVTYFLSPFLKRQSQINTFPQAIPFMYL